MDRSARQLGFGMPRYRRWDLQGLAGSGLFGSRRHPLFKCLLRRTSARKSSPGSISKLRCFHLVPHWHRRRHSLSHFGLLIHAAGKAWQIRLRRKNPTECVRPVCQVNGSGESLADLTAVNCGVLMSGKVQHYILAFKGGGCNVGLTDNDYQIMLILVL